MTFHWQDLNLAEKEQLTSRETHKPVALEPGDIIRTMHATIPQTGSNQLNLNCKADRSAIYHVQARGFLQGQYILAMINTLHITNQCLLLGITFTQVLYVTLFI